MPPLEEGAGRPTWYSCTDLTKLCAQYIRAIRSAAKPLIFGDRKYVSSAEDLRVRCHSAVKTPSPRAAARRDIPQPMSHCQPGAECMAGFFPHTAPGQRQFGARRPQNIDPAGIRTARVAVPRLAVE